MIDMKGTGILDSLVSMTAITDRETNNFVIIDGKKYERRRYTYDELRELFYGKVVIVEDAVIENCNLVDGILIGACNSDEEDELAIEYNKDGYKYTFWGFCSFPVSIGYRELI